MRDLQPGGSAVPGLIAYFSMEFGLSEALPIYSGGLGILAGDFLKAASDLGAPIVGVGLLWQQGYFRQALSPAGEQIELFPFNDPGQLPIVPLRDNEGEWLTISLQFPRRVVRLRVWEVKAGRVRLYLLDANTPVNNPADRGLTGELYGGGPEMRLQQEMILGIGGWQVLRELGLEPDVCHLNEGHAAFAVLERARCFMDGPRRGFRRGPDRHPTGQPIHDPYAGRGGFRPLLALIWWGSIWAATPPISASTVPSAGLGAVWRGDGPGRGRPRQDRLRRSTWPTSPSVAVAPSME